MSTLETRQKVFERKLFESYKNLETMDSKAGFVYVCVNDAWPNICKVGCTRDPLKRLATFSTYDPYDSYRLVGYKLVDDMREYEKSIHKILQEFRIRGEWFNLIWTRIVGIIHSPEKAELIFRDFEQREKESKRDKTIKQTKHSSSKVMLSIKKNTRESRVYPWKYEPLEE